MEEGNKSKEVDLMEQVRNTSYDEKSLFALCKEQVLEIIKLIQFDTTADLWLFNKLLKYFGLSFSEEIRGIVLGKYCASCFDLCQDAEKENKFSGAIAELNTQKYFIYDDYRNRCCGNAPYLHAKWLIDENSFEITLCNVIKACHLFNFYGDKKQFIVLIKETLKDFYNICSDDDAEFGYRVIPKYNIEIRQAVENEPSLQSVMKYYYQNDIKKALAELRKITEFSDIKNEKFKNFVLSQSEDLQEMCKKVYKFTTTYESHLAENAGASETEARIWLDLGLSIYRLYLMNSK